MNDEQEAPVSPLENEGDDDDNDETVENELEAEPEEISKADEDFNNDDEDWSPEEEKLNRKRKNLINTPASAAKRRKGTRGHTCSECDKHFAHLPQFLVHRREHRKTRNSTLSKYFDTSYEQVDGKKGKLFKKCKRCDFRSSEKGLQHYAEHLLSHEQDTTPTSGPNGVEIFHSCNLCSETFILKVNLTLHKFWVHDPFATRLKCDICVDPVNYDSKEELITHLKLHGDKIHSCKSCSVSCSTLDGLLEHMLKHTPSKRLFCPECDALPPFTSIYNVYRHCSIEHKELKTMFDCSSCEKSFLTADLLRLHATKQHRIFDDKGPSISNVTLKLAIFRAPTHPCNACVTLA